MPTDSFQETNEPPATLEEIITARQAQITAVQRFVAARQRLNKLQERIVQIEAQRITPPPLTEIEPESVQTEQTEQGASTLEITVDTLIEAPVPADKEYVPAIPANAEIDLLPADGDLEALPAEHFAPDDDPDKTETLEIRAKVRAEIPPSNPTQIKADQVSETSNEQLSKPIEPDGTE